MALDQIGSMANESRLSYGYAIFLLGLLFVAISTSGLHLPSKDIGKTLSAFDTEESVGPTSKIWADVHSIYLQKDKGGGNILKAMVLLQSSGKVDPNVSIDLRQAKVDLDGKLFSYSTYPKEDSFTLSYLIGSPNIVNIYVPTSKIPVDEMSFKITLPGALDTVISIMPPTDLEPPYQFWP